MKHCSQLGFVTPTGTFELFPNSDWGLETIPPTIPTGQRVARLFSGLRGGLVNR